MFTDEDIAFQREMLANPADTTLKLVYADWLQDRADPRAQFVRLQVQLVGMVDSFSEALASGFLGTLGETLDPGWVAFMTTLAQPFVPIRFDDELFADPIGHRGRVAAFASQFHAPGDWSEGLLADLVFLVGNRWGVEDDEHFGHTVRNFLCACPAEATFRTTDEVKAALPLAPAGRNGTWPDRIKISPADSDKVTGGWERQLREHVANGCRYDVERQLSEFSSGGESRPCRFGLTFGKSPHGDRLVGAFWWRWG